MATIDELSIEVQSSAKKVDGTIDKVAEQLANLANAVSSVDVGKMHSMSTAMKKIADASIGFKGNKSNEIRSLASALNSFDKVNTNSLYSAYNAVEKLADGMKGVSGVSFNADGILNVSNALSKLGGVKPIEGTKNLKRVKNDLVDFSKGLNDIGVVNFDSTGLSNVISSVAKLGGKSYTKDGANATSNLKEIKKNLLGFVSGLNGIKKVDFDTEGLSNLITSVSKLGRVSAQNATKNIPLLATALKNMMSTLSRMPTVSGNVIQMTNALANLAGQGGRVGTASNSLVRGLNNISTGAKKTQKNIFSLATSFGKFYAVFWGIKRALSAFSGSIELASDLTEVQNVIDVTFGKSKGVVEDFSKNAIKQFGISELASKQTAGRFQAMGTAIGFSQGKMADMSVELTKLSADMASFYNVSQKEVATSLQSIFTGETEPMRRYGTDLTQATLQEWALKQGIEANMQTMSQAEKVMLRYQYVIANTGAAAGDFARTSASWANQVRILKEQFKVLGSVIGGTFINALKPLVTALNVVLGKVISFAKTVSNALGKIFGWTIEISSGGLTNDIGADLSEAAGGADDLVDGLGGANDSAKKLQKTLSLLPFDQLNQLTGNKDSGSSGSGSGGKGDGSVGGGANGEDAMANLVKTDTIFDKYKSEIDTLYELGEYIGDTLTKAMNDIDWDKVYQGARDFGKGLADFLNGLISPELFGATGRTIAGALNTALHALDSFGETFNWKEFGLSIATGINEFFMTFDFKLFAKTINVWANGLLDTLITALDNTDWDMIGRQIGTFLAEIDFLKIAVKLGKALWKAINGAIKTYSNMFSKAPVETALLSLLVIPKALKAIVDTKFAKGIMDLADKFKTFATAAKLTVSTFGGNTTAVAALANNFPKLSSAVDVAKTAFANFQFGLQNGGIFAGVGEGIKVIQDNLSGMQKGIIGVTGVIAEFWLSKSAFEDIALGSDNIVESLAKLTIGAGAAAAALKLIGLSNPLTAAITGATMLTAAIVGVGDAMDEITEKRVGEAVKESLTNPGGIPIDEIASNFIESTERIGNSFSLISERSEELDSADSNIKDVWLEIEKVETAMQAGTTSVEEGTKRLSQLFGDLSQIAQDKFNALESTLMAAFGENGSLTGAYERLGVDTQSTMQNVMQVNDSTMQRMREITSELSGLDPTNPKYAELRTEYANLMATTDELSRAISNYELKVNSTKIDYGKLFLTDGSLNDEYLKSILSSMGSAMEQADKEMNTAAENINQALNEELKNAIAMKDFASAEEIQAKIDALPQAMDLLKNSVGGKSLEITDAIQTHFVQGINNQIESAKKDWESRGWGEKLYDSIVGKTEDSYIQEKVESYKKSHIDPLAENIEGTFSQLGIDGAGWSSDAAKEIIDSLFKTTTVNAREGVPQTITSLNGSYKSIITGATKGLKEEAEKSGRYTIDGYNEGIKSSDSTSRMIEKMKEAIEAARKTNDSHSPSLVYKSIGKDTVDGYNLGISENAASTTKLVSKWLSDILDSFSLRKSKFMDFGKEYMDGLKSGLESQWTSVERWLEDIPGKISDAIGDLYSTGKRAAQSFADGFKSVKVPVPHLYVSSWNTETSGDATYSTPNYDVSWYKTGGLFYKSSVIGVGEAGKEAVLPLENKRTMKMISEAIIGGMSLGSGESPFLENIALNTQRTEVWCERILQSAQESAMEIQRTQEKISSGVERVISKVSEIYAGVKSSFGKFEVAAFTAMNVPFERLISVLDYKISIISVFLSDIRDLIENFPNRKVFGLSDSSKLPSDIKTNAFEPVRINMKNILESMQSKISDDISKNALDVFSANTSVNSPLLTRPEEIFKRKETHFDNKAMENSYGKQCGGINEEMLANAVAEGVAMALMNNYKNLQQKFPEYIQNNIYYDGDVMVRVISKAQDDRGYRFNPA